MTRITSLQNPLVKQAAALLQKKYRDEAGLFLVEGEGPCMDAIARGWDCVTLFAAPPFLKRRKEGDDAPATETTLEILQKITKKTNPQNVIGVFRQRLFAAPERAAFHLALEEIRDPGNLGTIMRTAHAVGVIHIILLGPCCDPFAPEAIRASMGSFAFIHLSAMTPEAFLQWRKAQGLALIGTDVTDAADYRKADYRDAVLVMGNEQKGLSPALKAHCTSRVHIPMPGGTESLNLSVATGLLLYQSLTAH